MDAWSWCGVCVHGVHQTCAVERGSRTLRVPSDTHEDTIAARRVASVEGGRDVRDDTQGPGPCALPERVPRDGDPLAEWRQVR